VSVVTARNREVAALAQALVECGRLRDHNPLTTEQQKGRRLQIFSAPRRPDVATLLETGSFAERIAIAEAGAYTLRLVDDTLIQLMWVYEGDRLIKHRFAWLPAPLPPATDPQEEDLTAEERLGSSLADMGDLLRLGGALRIDHDLDAAAPHHPATHLTVFGPGMEEGRLPIRGPWCLGRFCRFVFDQLAPPFAVVDERRAVDEAHRTRLAEAVPMTSDALGIDPVHTRNAWLTWGAAPADRGPEKVGRRAARG
jgi:hypothetical protein